MVTIPITGNVLVLGQVCDHHRDAARCALGWVVDNTVKLREKLGSKLKVRRRGQAAETTKGVPMIVISPSGLIPPSLLTIRGVRVA